MSNGARRAALLRRALADRWLGAGLATIVSIVVLGLAAGGQLTLYIAPETVWFACAGAVVTILVTVLSFAVPLGRELDHGHDHGHEDAEMKDASALAAIGTTVAGVAASAGVLAALVLPPASLSVELAMSRDVGGGTLFAGADSVSLGNADTSTFGIGDWASVFATSTRPEQYDGRPVTLTGFVTPAGDDPDRLRLTRMVITHCVIDAQPAAVPVSMEAWGGAHEVGGWIEVTGTVRVADDGSLVIAPESVAAIAEPSDPYEF